MLEPTSWGVRPALLPCEAGFLAIDEAKIAQPLEPL